MRDRQIICAQDEESRASRITESAERRRSPGQGPAPHGQKHAGQKKRWGHNAPGEAQLRCHDLGCGRSRHTTA